MRYKIGPDTYAEYGGNGQSLPEVRIAAGKRLVGSWRGSSLGPCNAMCDPDDSDLAYWQSLAGLPDDPAQRTRSLAAHRAAHTRAYPPQPDVRCKCGKTMSTQCADALGECLQCAEQTESIMREADAGAMIGGAA